MSWWSEALADRRQAVPENPRVPRIPQPPPADDLGDLVEQARAAMLKATPARSVAERFGHAPGQDIATTARRPGPAAGEAQPSQMNLSPQERAMVVELGVRAGRFADTERAKAARDHAAEVRQLIKDHAWDITEDTTPRRVQPAHIAGSTYQR